MGETVFSKLAEEVLLAAIANPFNALDLRWSAARRLIGMWDDRLSLTVTRLPGILLSAWRARARIRAVFGTLIGVTELLSLVQEHCEPTFIDDFVRERVTGDEQVVLRWTPRFRRRRASSANQLSTRFGQEPLVGVK